jgi:hypothetical protein
LWQQQQRRRRYAPTADHIHTFGEFHCAGERGCNHGCASGHWRIGKRIDGVLADLRFGNICDADRACHGKWESVWVVDRMHDCEHGDLHGYDEREYDGDGELYGAGGYGNHGDADDGRHDWSIAAVHSNGYGDGRVHERGNVVDSAANRQPAKRGDDYIRWTLSDTIPCASDGECDGNQHL